MSLFIDLPEFFAVAPNGTDRYMFYRNSVMRSTFGMVWTTNVVEPLANPVALHSVKVPSQYTGATENVQIRCPGESVMRSTQCVRKDGCVVLDVNGVRCMAPVYSFVNYAVLPRGALPVIVMPTHETVSAVWTHVAPEIFEHRHLPVAAPIAPAARAPSPVGLPLAVAVGGGSSAPAPAAASLPAHIKRLVIADAVSRKEICPISQEEITEANAAVTSCGHVFDAESIRTWLATPASRGCCPMCKQHCCA